MLMAKDTPGGQKPPPVHVWTAPESCVSHLLSGQLPQSPYPVRIRELHLCGSQNITDLAGAHYKLRLQLLSQAPYI